MDYTVVIEKGPQSYGAYCLDIDGLYAFGDGEDNVLEKIEKAISDRIAELRAEGRPVPRPSNVARTIHIAA